MSNTKIKSLMKQISDADSVIVDNNINADICVGEYKGEPDNQVVYIEWEYNYNQHNIKITEEGLDNAVIKDNAIKLEDHEGDEFTIKLFDLAKHNVVNNW